MPSDSGDVALETLFLPLLDGSLNWPSRGALFLGARDGWPLYRQPLPGLVCEQDFKPEVDALQRSGHMVCTHSIHTGMDSVSARSFPLVLVLPPRQRDQARAMLARAIGHLEPGGVVLASAANDEGARSLETDLARLGGPVRSVSKNRCRVFWTAPERTVGDATLAAEWLQLDAPRPVVEGRFISRPGVFAWDRVDTASALLAAHLPADLAGRAADLGAGYGLLSTELLQHCGGIRSLHVYEADARALDLARANLAGFTARVDIDYRWHDVAAGLADVYDVIVTNPPFHAGGRADRPDIGRRFITAAAAALVPGGRLWLVANRHLPYEAVLHDSFDQVRYVAQQQGYKVVEAVKAPEIAPHGAADARPPQRRQRR